jgi:hypothetical protein
MTKLKVEQFAQEDYLKYRDYFKNFSNSSYAHYQSVGFYECYLKTLYFKNWKAGLNSIGCTVLDHLYDELHHDVNSSYFLSSIGLYRSSNMHLRSMVELSFQVIYFFEHPVELEKWRQGNFIIKHDKLKDYIKEHPRFTDRDVNKKVSTLVEQISKEWKVYSKHIHAESLGYFQTQKESEINKEFSIPEFRKWKTKYLYVIEKVNNLHILFFGEELKRFPSTNKRLIKSELA